MYHWWMKDVFGEWYDELIHFLSTQKGEKRIGPYWVYHYPPLNDGGICHYGKTVVTFSNCGYTFKNYNHSQEWTITHIIDATISILTMKSHRPTTRKPTTGPLPYSVTLTEMGVILDAEWATDDRTIPLEEVDKWFDAIPLLDNDETVMLWELTVG